jgi:hypothetical protein
MDEVDEELWGIKSKRPVRRYIKWLVVVVVIVPVLICGGVVAWFSLVFSNTNPAPAYEMAVNRARKDKQLVETLGEPVNASEDYSWRVYTSIGSEQKQLRLEIPIEGPQGKGVLRANATKSSKEWRLKKVQFFEQKTVSTQSSPAAPSP